MRLALKRIKVYLKLGTIITIAVVMFLLVVMNRNHKTDIWFFHRFQQVNVLWLILISAVVSILSWWGLRKIRGAIYEFKQLRRTAREKEQIEAQQRMAAELAEREKRIDEKIRRSLTENSGSSGGGDYKD